jgi:hypothetical protein
MKEKEKCEQVACITCNTEVRRKEECLSFVHHKATGEMKPLAGGVGYFEICKTWGHHLTTCTLF